MVRTLFCFVVHIFACLLVRANPDGAMLTRFRNLATYDICLWWLTPYSDEEIRFFGHLSRNGGMTSFTSYVGHRFFWAKPDRQHDKSARTGFFSVSADQILYVYEDERAASPAHVLEATYDELAFLRNYYETYNRHWLSSYERPAPVIPFVKTESAHPQWTEVTSDSYFWSCDPSQSDGSKKRRILRHSRKYSECQDTNDGNPLWFRIEQLHSKDPRIYKIDNFISEYEAKHIVEISKAFMHRSTVGDGKNRRQDPTRTCTNTWLTMNHSAVVETVYNRIGDVLGISKHKMSVSATFSDNGADVDGVASHMEVIHFATNEHYSRHYDNAVTDDIFLHFITFQVILTTSEGFKGGETLFPHAGSVENDGRHTTGHSVASIPLRALFWYNLLVDGNLDETSMYSNSRVKAGEQWMFHVSIWDPTLPVHGDPKMPHSVIYAMHDEL